LYCSTNVYLFCYSYYRAAGPDNRLSGVAVEDDLAEQIKDDTGFNANDARRIARLLRPVAGQAVQ